MAKKDTYTVKLIQETTTQTQSIEVPVIEGYSDIKIPKKTLYKTNDGFLTIFKKAIVNIARFAKLTKNEHQLLLYLLGSCQIDNSICIDLNVLSEDLGMDKGNVSRALGGLVKRNIVIRRDGYRYSTNPLPFELAINYDQINYNVGSSIKIAKWNEVHNKHPKLTNIDGTLLDPLEEQERLEEKNRREPMLPGLFEKS